MKKHLIALGLLSVMLFSSVNIAEACTSLIVTKGASTDGSVMITYAMDTHTMYGELYFHPAADHKPGTMRKIFDIDNGKYHGSIPEVAHTYATIGNMNEFQVAISETTFTGREELQDTTGIIDYGSLIYTTLSRAKTAREAIQIMVDLANTYGYCSTGESFSIADKNEAWIMEVLGKGTKMVKGKNVNKGI
ncbi:MAG: C69 family dipeptidase, partial [Rikenellaceae bacterium]